MILAGHGRVAAAPLAGLTEVPCVRLEEMTPSQKRAYILADNKLALIAGWDDEILANELQTLLSIDAEFDLDVIGFTIAGADCLIEGLTPEESGDPADDQTLELAKGKPITVLGDLWQLGDGRLVCGSALEDQTYQLLLAGEKAQMVFTDPPYNVPITGHAGNSGKIQHREFDMASGEMSSAQFKQFLVTTCSHLAANSVDGSIHFICMDWRHLPELLAAGETTYMELKNLIVWAKDNGGMGTFYRSRHELILVFKNGTAPHINSFELGQHGRYRTNVWQYRGVNTFKSGRMDELSLHPTVKPVAMIADAIKDVSKRNSVVLDVFGGSGSTLIAAHKTGHRGYLIELDPLYCDLTIRRWQVYAKDDAVLVSTGQTFEEVVTVRQATAAKVA